jgi:hypothetical protein
VSHNETNFNEFVDTAERLGKLGAIAAMEAIHSTSQLAGTPKEQVAVMGVAIADLATAFVLSGVRTKNDVQPFIDMIVGAMERAKRA